MNPQTALSREEQLALLDIFIHEAIRRCGGSVNAKTPATLAAILRETGFVVVVVPPGLEEVDLATVEAIGGDDAGEPTP